MNPGKDLSHELLPHGVGGMDGWSYMIETEHAIRAQ